MRSYHPFRKKYITRKTPPTPPGMRRELAGVIFDLLMDGTAPAAAEQQIRDVAKSPAEANAAISRYRLVVGCNRLAVPF